MKINNYSSTLEQDKQNDSAMVILSDADLLKELKNSIDRVKRIALTTHIHPDGDAIGGMLGFYELLLQLNKDVRMFVDDSIPEKFKFLKYTDKIKTATDYEGFDNELLIVLDASTYERIGRIGPMTKTPIYNLDHHISNSKFADLLYLKPNFAATGEVVAYLCEVWNVEITPSMADALYMAIATDCGFFKFSNTTSHTMQMAAKCLTAGARPNVISEAVEQTSMARIEVMKAALQTVTFHQDGKIACISLRSQDMEVLADDTDGFVELIRNVDAVDVAILLKEVNSEMTRVSLRSKSVDVNAVAGAFGGGGHIRAAGCTIKASLEKAKALLLQEICK